LERATAPARIETRRLVGHRVTADDLDYLLESDADIRIQRWLFGKVQTPEQSQARLDRWLRMWQEHGLGFWVFQDLDRAVVGHGGLFVSPRESGEVEVGYVVKPAYWNRGFATEITMAALRIGFESLDLRRIIGIALSINAPSRRVLEKCGMNFETELASPDGVAGVRYAIAKETWAKRI
jgi:RimJ/RimL family protein N-acetyltransferase